MATRHQAQCPCKSQPEATSTEVVWENPSGYDMVQHGPPYLPTKLTKKQASVVWKQAAMRKSFLAPVGTKDMSPLASLLVALQAASMVHQGNHWMTQGPSFYGDHLMFERCYDATQGQVDGVAERAVGLGNPELVNPSVIVPRVAKVVQALYQDKQSSSSISSDLVSLSLAAELGVLQVIEYVYNRLKVSGGLSSGVDDMLQGLASEHEVLSYLLKQRIST